MTVPAKSTEQEVKLLIAQADAAINAEDFEALMRFYADDATLVVMPGKLGRVRKLMPATPGWRRGERSRGSFRPSSRSEWRPGGTA